MTRRPLFKPGLDEVTLDSGRNDEGWTGYHKVAYVEDNHSKAKYFRTTVPYPFNQNLERQWQYDALVECSLKYPSLPDRLLRVNETEFSHLKRRLDRLYPDTERGKKFKKFELSNYIVVDWGEDTDNVGVNIIDRMKDWVDDNITEPAIEFIENVEKKGDDLLNGMSTFGKNVEYAIAGIGIAIVGLGVYEVTK
jgi:hypothetical protein